MYNFLSRKGQLIAFGLGAIISVIFLISVLGGSAGFDDMSKEDQFTTSIFNFGLQAAIALTVLCFIVAVLFGLIQMFSNLKGSLKGIVGIAAIAAIFFIGRSMAGADSASIMDTLKAFDVTNSQSAFISGSIMTAIVMAVIAAAAFVLSEIVNIFK